MENYLNAHKRKDTEIRVVSIPKTPQHLEYYSYDALVIPEILRIVRKSEKEGFDAVIIGCFYDLGLHEAREVSNIIITAPCESSLIIAQL